MEFRALLCTFAPQYCKITHNDWQPLKKLPMIAQPSKKLNYLFTSESVSEGHPDKVADQISDTVLDNLLAWDPSSKVACETLVTTGQVVLAGEIKTQADVELREAVRETIKRIVIPKLSICLMAIRVASSLPFMRRAPTSIVVWNAKSPKNRALVTKA